MTKINLEIPDCPICGQSTFETLHTDLTDNIWQKPGRFNIQRCTECALVMTRPRPSPDSLGFYYDNTYSGEDRDGMAQFHQGGLMKLISQYRLRVMEKVRPVVNDSTILDVGCSYGGFLTTVREVRGCTGVGIDLDEGALKQAPLSDELSFWVTEITDYKGQSGSFDWVTFWESLEHHTHPIKALESAHFLLKPDGLCCVEVPNYNGFWRRVFGKYWLPFLMPQHLFHFTKSSLQKTGEAAGFRLVHHQTMFYPLEGVASLGIALAKLLRSPPPGSPPSWRTPFDIMVFLFLVLLYFFVEIPSQLLLSLSGQSGHQLAVFQKKR